MTDLIREESSTLTELTGLDLMRFGQRLRHLRRARGFTLADLGVRHLKVGTRVPNDVLEHVVALYTELRRQRNKPTATPEEARQANAVLRQRMRERGNYFPAIERAAAQTLDAVGYRDAALSQGT